MILRSVMQHVRDQNWFAVGLDFLIVVVGVFIGIQVANWNEGRIERIEEREILARLVDDFRGIVGAGSAYLERSAQQRRLMERWIDASDRGEPLDLDRIRAFTIEFYELEDPARAQSVAEGSDQELFTEPLGGERRPEVSITFQQLVASGDLKLIRSQRLRGALARRNALREEAIRAIAVNNGLAPSIAGSAFIQPTFQAASPNARIVLEAALADPDFMLGLRGFYGLRLYNETWFQRVHTETERVLAILEEEVGNP